MAGRQATGSKGREPTRVASAASAARGGRAKAEAQKRDSTVGTQSHTGRGSTGTSDASEASRQGIAAGSGEPQTESGGEVDKTGPGQQEGGGATLHRNDTPDGGEGGGGDDNGGDNGDDNGDGEES